jgi:MarR family transcriptional regulator, lower aerobic nicotinate degradation pathway regulator
MLRPAELDAHLGFLLRQVSNAVSQDFARRLAGEGVTVAEWVVLRALHDEPALAPSALAARLALTRGAISKLADRLIAKHLIVRRDDPQDGRGQLLALSPEGRALVPVLADHADRNDAEYFDVLTAPERSALTGALRKLIARRRLRATPTD